VGEGVGVELPLPLDAEATLLVPDIELAVVLA
jgi:hypothetical protein